MTNTKFDLEERTAKFGESIISFVKDISQDHISKILINQLVRSSTSIGANYCEADCAETKKDFEHKIGLCNKEAKETKHWLRMLRAQAPKLNKQITAFSKEASELNLIFCAIIKKSKQNNI